MAQIMRVQAGYDDIYELRLQTDTIDKDTERTIHTGSSARPELSLKHCPSRAAEPPIVPSHCANGCIRGVSDADIIGSPCDLGVVGTAKSKVEGQPFRFPIWPNCYLLSDVPLELEDEVCISWAGTPSSPKTNLSTFRRIQPICRISSFCLLLLLNLREL